MRAQQPKPSMSWRRHIWGVFRRPGTWAILGILLGVAGHLQSRANASSLDWADAFFGAVRYLVLDGFESPSPDGPLHWSMKETLIRLSQLAGVLFALTGAAAILDKLTQLPTRAWFWGRMRFRQDIDLLIGVGEHGHSLLRLDKGGRQKNTLAIDANPSPQAIEACRCADVPLLHVDANTDTAMAKLRPGHIARVFVATDSDPSCAAIVHRLAEHFQAHGRSGVRLYARARSVRVLDTLLQQDIERKNMEIHMYTDEAVTARMFYQRLNDEEKSGLTRFNDGIDTSRFVLIGAGKLADAILQQCLHNDIFEDDKTVRVDVVHPQARQAAERFARHYPCYVMDDKTARVAEAGATLVPEDDLWLKEKVLPRIDYHSLPVSARGQIEWAEKHLSVAQMEKTDTTIAVVFDDFSEAVAVLRAIEPVLRWNTGGADKKPLSLQVWVYVKSQWHGAVFHGENLKISFDAPFGIHVFSDYLDQCSKSQVANDKVERAAMKVHHVYSGSPTDMAPEILWNASGLSEWHKASSRYCATHAWVKTGIQKRHKNVDLARVEHRRWCAFHLLAGFRPLVIVHDGLVRAEDEEKVRQWFNSNKKKLYQSQKYHIDLISFNDLLAFDQVVSGAGKREQKKDQQLVENLEAIIDFAEKPRSTHETQ